jgi:hypothetical protein
VVNWSCEIRASVSRCINSGSSNYVSPPSRECDPGSRNTMPPASDTLM